MLADDNNQIVRVPYREVASLDLKTFKKVAIVGLEDNRCAREWREFLSTAAWILLNIPVPKWVLRMIPWMVQTGRRVGRYDS